MQRRITLAATAASLLIAASPAAAHTELQSTSPAAGSTHTTGLRAVRATFTAAIRSGTLRVTGPGGAVVSKGKGGRDRRKISRLRVRLKRSLTPGRYQARWTIQGLDGHTQTGSFNFRLR